MVKHTILWTLDDTLSSSELIRVKEDMKTSLEALNGRIEGLLELRIYINPMPTANCDVMLESLFASKEALAFYATHPEHVAIADSKVRPYTKSRLCMDCEI